MDGGLQLFEYLWSESDRSFRPCWAREVFSGAAGLTRALRAVGLVCRAPMEAYPKKRKYVQVYDLDQIDVYWSLLRECAAGCYV